MGAVHPHYAPHRRPIRQLHAAAQEDPGGA